MRLSAVAFLMILTTVFLSGCDTAKVASVEDRGGNFYSRNGVMHLADAAPVAPIVSPPVSHVAVAPVREVQPLIASTGNIWQWPVQGKVTETFGQKSDGIVNEGIVIAAAEGTPIHAAQAGEVAFVGKDTKTYGNIVILRHANGEMTSYAHAREISVAKGQKLAAGSILGSVGKSGSAKAPQLHFAVREGNASVDPLNKLPHQLASN